MQIEMSDVKESSVRIIKKGDADYPERMKNLGDMPDVLYVLGRLPDDNVPTVAVVGARMCSPYGRRMAEEFGRILAGKGVQIISGMALGVDGYAHRGSLEAGGKTFAVLGNGVNICYPAKNRDIYEKIRNTGGIISEQPLGTEPLPYYFPRRNRIISALADIVLVVEAREKSGSLITAGFAAEQGRDVFAVPGRVGDALSDGCNRLIADGAFIAAGPNSILERLETLQMTLNFEEGRKRKARRKRAGRQKTDAEPMRSLSDEAAAIYRHLDANESLSADALSKACGLDTRQISEGAGELLLEGLAEEVGRGFYIKK